MDTLFCNDEFPILTVRNSGGDAEIVEGEEIEDFFVYTSSATEVVVTIEPPSGDSIIVTTLTGPTWYEDVSSGAWDAEFTIPSPGNEVSGTFEVKLGSGGEADNGHFNIKKQGNGGGSGGCT